MARARVPATAMLVELLAVAMAATATAAVAVAVADKSTSICDTAKCGKGTCSEVPGIIPLLSAGYKCTCDSGWYQQRLSNLTSLPFASLPFAPCIIPDCSFSGACSNLTMPTPPIGVPLTDPCVFAYCGQGGLCEKGAGFSYQCRCQPGFRNLLDDTSMPCIGRNCFFGPDCAKLGLVNNAPAAPAPAPVVGNGLY